MEDSEQIHTQLMEEYSSLIDSSTLLAILSDYNLTNAHELAAAKQTLDILRDASGTEDANGFDPSGVSGVSGSGSGLPSHDYYDDDPGSSKSLPDWKSNTDGTSLCLDMSPLCLGTSESTESEINLSGNTDSASPFELDLSGDETEQERLIKMFPRLKPFDVTWILKKCKGDANLAIDELITQSFLEESGIRRRGIEAFSEDEYRSQPKRKGKKKRNLILQESSDGSMPKSAVQNSKWDGATRDINFIATKTSMPPQQVGSIYHSNGASLRTTITALVAAHKQLQIPEDSVIAVQAFELREDFPSLAHSDLVALLHLARSISDSRELARAMLAVSSEPFKPRIEIEFRHVPLDIYGELSKSKSLPRLPREIPEIAISSAQAKTYNSARDQAFVQASSYYRKGKSDHLMGGAAAYYSQIGHDYDARAKAAESATADALVASQSTRDSLDLHGVNVKDALRISRERVTTWWHELEEKKEGGKGVGAGYKIVTGVGNHSEGGRGKLGPAVGKMLMREGWKVQVGSGVLLVTGAVRR